MTKNIVDSTMEGSFTRATRARINNNLADVSIPTAQLDATTNTVLANVPGLVTGNLDPGTYYLYASLAGTATSNGGWKVGLKQGTASMLTTVGLTSTAYTASAAAVTHSTSTTDQASLIAATSAYISAEIEGIVIVGLSGTLQVQFAQNASHADTSSLYVDCYFSVTRIGN